MNVRMRFVLWMTLMVAGAAQAEPQFAVRMGLPCSACHENGTGGGLRNAFGNTFAQALLAERSLPPLPAGAWTGALGSHLSLGADLRASGHFDDVPGRGSENRFDLDELRLYLQLEPIPDRLAIYVDQRVAPGASANHEAHVRFWLADRRLWLKGGQFYLPYGLRFEDDTAFVRQATGINMTTPDTGLEAGWERGPWSLQVALTNGSAGAPESDPGKQWTFRAEHVRSRWRLGASASRTSSDVGDRRLVGTFAGLRTGPIAWLAEVDRIADEGFPGGRREQWAGLVEANWNFRRGHNLKLTAEGLEPDADVDEDERARYGLLWEYTPWPYVQVRAGVRVYDGIPQNALQNRRQLILEWHAFF